MKKRKLEVVVISDIHLGTRECKAEELLIYLSSIKPKMLVLNGDIFGSKPGKNPFPKSHIKVVKKILSFLSDGTKVYYLTGGPQENLKNFADRQLSGLRFQDRLILELDGKSTCILHGGIFDISPRWATWLGKLGTLGYRILCVYRQINQKAGKREGPNKISQDPKVRSMALSTTDAMSKFDRTAAEMAIHNDYDTMICGYSHQPRKAVFENSKGKCLYLNSGDWTDSLTALEYSLKRWKLYSFSLDKLTAFYGDEALNDLNFQDMLKQTVKQSPSEEETRTAS